MKKNINLLALLFLAALSGCRSDVVFEAQKDIPNGRWMYSDTMEYRFDIADTSLVYNMYLDIAHADTFAYQNLYVKLTTIFPDGKRLKKTLSLDLFDAKGNPIGKKSGNGITQHLLLQENTFFNKAGQYGLTVEQNMRRDSLPGISRLGLSIQKTKK